MVAFLHGHCRLADSHLFFSSRRRHTRLVSDWSSDVCSSDLARRAPCVPRAQPRSTGVRPERSTEAALVGRTERASRLTAALVNGTAGHALDFDDTHTDRKSVV